MQHHGPWKIQNSREVYRDAWLAVQLDDVTRPDGQPGTYTTVQLKSGVCVIAVDEHQQVHLTREFHYAVGRVTLEGVSGGIESGESPRSTAERELAEELGLTAKQWRHLGRVDPFTAAIHSPVDLYVARELSTCGSTPEGTEQIEHVVMPFAEALQALQEGKITHAPTCVALLWLAMDEAAPPPLDAKDGHGG
jgi:ADP-ribose pyrophosphatase